MKAFPHCSPQQLAQSYVAQISRQLVRGRPRDDFGLPQCPSLPELLEQRPIRHANALQLARAAVEAVLSQVGRDEAKKIFDAELAPANKGKQADLAEHEAIFLTYDAAIASGTDPKAALQLVAAKLHQIRRRGSAASTLRQVRRVLKDRDDCRVRYAAFCKEGEAINGPSLLSDAMQRVRDI